MMSYRRLLKYHHDGWIIQNIIISQQKTHVHRRMEDQRLSRTFEYGTTDPSLSCPGLTMEV